MRLQGSWIRDQMTAEALVGELRGLAPRGVAMTADSRRVAKGDVFLAFPGDVHDGSHYIVAALEAGLVEPGTVLEIGLIENMINVDNSPDFGLHFGIRHRF